MINIYKIKDINFKEIERLHLNYFKERVIPSIEEVLNRPRGRYKRFYQYLYFNIDKIAIGKPDQLNKIISHIQVNFSVECRLMKKKENKILKDLNYIFNYDSFQKRMPSKSNLGKWGAYKLAEKLNINVCPYCNRQYIFTYYSDPIKGGKVGRTRPTLDHFFSKVIYPYLSISLYNLIPSCKICNSDLKGTKNFNYGDFMHPYEEEFGNNIKFRTRLRKNSSAMSIKELYNINFFFGKCDEFDIVLINNETKNKYNKSFYKRAWNNIRTFKIQELYNKHKDYVIELIRKEQCYNEESINNLLKTADSKLFKNKEEIMQMIVSNYISIENFDKRILAKFIKDISEELGLLDYI